MQFLLKYRLGLQLLSLTLALFLVSPCYATGINSARIYPTNKVTIFNGGQEVGAFTKEALLPEGYFLAADGNCAVKMDEIFMVAIDKSHFSISGSSNQRNLIIKKGTVYFRMSEMKRPINFVTPAGNISARSIILNASADNRTIMGFITTTQDGSELGIIKGGSMVVLTVYGLTTVSTGKKIMLAQADMDVGPPEGGESGDELTETSSTEEGEQDEPGMSTERKVAIGAVGAGAVAGGLLLLTGSGGSGSNNKDGDDDISPSNIQ
jgi:hypothetical protein